MSQNLLVILSDEHQSRAISGLGHFCQTPNLDRMMQAGTTFTNAYTPSPICVPARASFATGHFAHRNRLWDNAMPYTGAIKGWGHALQDAGIDVESIGKLHYRASRDPNGFDIEHHPMHVVDGLGMLWGSIRQEDRRPTPTTRMLGEYIGPGTSKYTDYDQAITDRAVQWFKDRRAQRPEAPFCLYIGLVAPHFPMVVPAAFYDLYAGMDDLPQPKLPAGSGHQNHPWVAKQNAQMDSEAQFNSPEERQACIAAYWGLVTWMDHNLGRILKALDDSGFADTTTVVYSSDHVDNVGARGLWGKSNLYEEAAAVPMVAVGPGFDAGAQVATPVSLLDLSVSIPAHFGLEMPEVGLGPGPGRDLRTLAAEPYDAERVVFSEYHAVGAVSGAFMIRKGDWKYNFYVGMEPELFDLRADPEELTNLAGTRSAAMKQSELHAELLAICDPEAIDRLAFADQAALIARHGGEAAARELGAPGATPPPEV